MSVILEFSIFPLDKGVSLSPYVARAADLIKASGLPCRIGPMGTAVEGEWEELMDLVTRCFDALKPDCDRIYLALKVDYRKGGSGRLEGKVRSLQEKMAP